MKKPLGTFSPLIKIALPAVAAAAGLAAMVGGGTQSRTASRSSRNPKAVAASVAPVAAPPSRDPLFAFSSPAPEHADGHPAKRAAGGGLWAEAYPRRGQAAGRSSGALLNRLNGGAGLLGKPELATTQSYCGSWGACQFGGAVCGNRGGPDAACAPAGDTTAPTLSSVTATATGTTTVNLVGTSNENGTGYWVVLSGSGATAPTAAQVKAGQTSAGSAAPFSGSAAMTAASAKTFSISGLTASTSYTVCLMAQDAIPNLSTVTCTNVTTQAPAAAITSATYDANTGVLAVTGTNMTNGGTITVANLTLTGQGGTYPLTSGNVTTSSATAFSVTLNAADKMNVNGLLNKDGLSAVGGTTYNLAAATNWDVTASAPADLTGNAITVSNVAAPTITSATYDVSTHVLAVTGTGLVKTVGATNDITVSTLTLKGEGAATYPLTSSNVEITDATSFSVTLNATDRAAVEQILNKDGLTSTGGTTYNLAAADDWDSVIGNTDTSDLTLNGINVSNVPVPTITSATYDATTGALVVTGTGFLKLSGATNDIVASKFTLTGEGGVTYTLTDTANVEITSGTAFTLTLSNTDKAAVNQIINKNGTASTSGPTTYNLAAAENWAAGAATGVTDVVATSGITASNVAVPAITSATYDASTGALVVTGTGFLKLSGATNDIVANKFTLTGEGGATYTLTDSSNVEISSGTSFTITLSATDKAAVNLLANKDGTASTSGTTFNLAAAENWTAGADAGVTDVDATSTLTANNVGVPAITSATYDYSTNVLVVTGTGFLPKTGATNDIDLTKLTITGESGATYTLTNATGVEITSATAFSVTLSGADLTNVEALLNKDGTSSVSGTTYNLSAAASWNRGDATNGSDTSNAITVSNYAAPTVTSATFDASTNVLTVTGANLISKSGATNDVTVSLLTLAGEGGSYALTSTDVEITNATTFAVTLNSADQLVVRGLLNKNGTSSSGATTYNLAAAEDWMAGTAAATVVADLTGNGITVSNFPTPTITSAVYDSDSGVLAVTGTNLFKKVGVTNDIVLNKLTFTGGTANATYTLTSASNVEITSATAFSVTLTGADKTSVDALLDNIGTVSTGGSTYNLAAADGWLGGADTAVNIADAVNAITVSISPKVTSATYDAATGTLVVTGTNMQAKGGVTNDITANKLTFTGEGGATYTLTDTADVELTSATSFTLVLSATDKAAINRIVNKNSTVSTGSTTYNIAVADDWNAQVTAGDTSDTVSNGVTASNVATPAITSATYNATTGALVVTGTGFLSASGATNDIVANKFTLTGEGGATYTLTDTANVEITSGTAFTLLLSATDKAALNQIINKNGTASTSATTYNLAAAEDWAAGADAAVVVADLTGNGVTASNVAVPAITSATFNVSTGALVVTGSGFSSLTGATNDIVANKFTFTGQGGATYTLTDTANVEITSGTAFTLTLSTTDKNAVASLLNKNGTASIDTTTYNLAAAEDWAAGADAAVVVADLAGNGITVSNALVKSISFSPSTISETAANDGAVGSSTVTLANDTFTGANGAALGAVTNVPAGLTASLVKASATTATLSFTGKATNHGNANDVANLTVTFGDADFTINSAADVTNATTSNLVIDFADPAPPVQNTAPTTPTTVLPTGGGTAILSNGQSVIVTENGKDGTSISLPPPITTPPTGTTPTPGAPTTNSVNVTLPGTGTIGVSSDSVGTQLGVTKVTLPGATTAVNTVTVDKGSASFSASEKGQAMAGLSNGITIVSGNKDSKVSVDATGTNDKIGGLTDNVTLVVPTGSSGVSGTKVDLPQPTASGGKTATVNLNIGGHELTVASSQSNSTMTFEMKNIGGVQTPVLAVTGNAQITTSGEDKPIVSVAGNVIKTGKSSGGGIRQVCNTIIQASSDVSSDVVHVVTCYIVLEPGTFSALSGGVDNSFAAIKDGIVWAGETAEFDKNGIVISAYLGTREGTTSAVGDDIVPGGNKFAANSFTNHAFIPRLTGSPLRLNEAKLDESLFGVFNSALNATTLPATPSQSAQGILNFQVNGGADSLQKAQSALTFDLVGDLVSVFPSKRIKVDTARADGVTVSNEGNVEVATGGLVTTFVPTVADPQGFAADIATLFPGAVSEMRWNGSWKVTTSDGRMFVGRPQWGIQSSAAGNGFAAQADGTVTYSINGRTQVLFPDFHDYTTLLATFAKELNDPNLKVAPRMNGSVQATVNGRTYLLYPQWTLIPASQITGKPSWWLDNGVVYIKNADGTAQGFGVK